MPEITLVGNLFGNLVPSEKSEGASSGSGEPQVPGTDAAGIPFSPILAELIAAQAALLKVNQERSVQSPDDVQLPDCQADTAVAPEKPEPVTPFSKELVSGLFANKGSVLPGKELHQIPWLPGSTASRLFDGQSGDAPSQLPLSSASLGEAPQQKFPSLTTVTTLAGNVASTPITAVGQSITEPDRASGASAQKSLESAKAVRVAASHVTPEKVSGASRQKPVETAKAARVTASQDGPKSESPVKLSSEGTIAAQEIPVDLHFEVPRLEARPTPDTIKVEGTPQTEIGATARLTYAEPLSTNPQEKEPLGADDLRSLVSNPNPTKNTVIADNSQFIVTRPELVAQIPQPSAHSSNTGLKQMPENESHDPLGISPSVAIRMAAISDSIPSMMMVNSSLVASKNMTEADRRTSPRNLGTASASEPQDLTLQPEDPGVLVRPGLQVTAEPAKWKEQSGGSPEPKDPGVLVRPGLQVTPEPTERKVQSGGSSEPKSSLKPSPATSGTIIDEPSAPVRTSDAIRRLVNLPVDEVVIVKNETGKPQTAATATPAISRPNKDLTERAGTAVPPTAQLERPNSVSPKSTEESWSVATVVPKSDIGQASSDKNTQTASRQKEHESNEPAPAAKDPTRLDGFAQEVVEAKTPSVVSALAAKDQSEAMKHQVAPASLKVDLRQDNHEAPLLKPLPLPAELLSSVHNQIAKDIALKVAGNVSEIRVMLKPESLGTVTINVRMEEGTMVARIDANQQNVRSALEGNLSQLRETLVSRGIQVDRIDVTTSAFSSFRESNAQQRERPKAGLRRGDDVEAVETYESARFLGYNTMDYLV